MREFIATHYAEGLSADEKDSLKAGYAREGYTDIRITSHLHDYRVTAYEFWGRQGGLCSACNNPLSGFVSANNDRANDLQFCQACTRLQTELEAAH